MRRKFNGFGLLTLAIVAVALWPAAASAQSSISTIYEWQMGESDSSPAPSVGATGLNPTVASVGGWNMAETGSPTYVAGAYPASTLAMNFTNSVYPTAPTQYYAGWGGTSFAAYTSANWGFDFWFNASLNPTVGSYMVTVGNQGTGNTGSRLGVKVALNQGYLFVGNSSGNNAYFSPTINTGSWYHVVYVDDNGTGQMWLNDTNISTNYQPVTGEPNGYAGTGATGIAAALSALQPNITVGCSNDNTLSYGYSGAIDDVRIFTLTQAGVFNITDTDPTGLAPVHNPGDVNGDKQVDINDLTIVLTNYGRTGMLWSQGAIDGDPTGAVDINDLTIVLTDYGKTYSAGINGIKAVPEPGTLALIAAGLAGLLAYAWRKRK